MGFELRPVPGFGRFPDGRLRAGPFVAEHVGMLHLMMDRLGIRPGAAGDTAMVSQTPQGMMISAQGEGVHGYFIDEEGIEVSRSDMDEFILSTVPRGVTCEISGHWCPDATRMIVVHCAATHDGRWVQWAETRQIVHADGRIQPIGDRSEQAIVRRGNLRLVVG